MAYAALITFLYAGIYQRIKDDRVFLGGDNADYHILATSLAAGQGYRYIAAPEAPPHNHFPPGYPALLSVFIRMGVTEHATLAHLNGFFLWAALMCLLVVFARWSDSPETAAVAIGLCALNAHLLSFSTIVMSEVPYLLCLAIALMCHRGALRAHERGLRATWWLVALVCAGVVMVYLRTAGLATVIALAAHMAWRKRRGWGALLIVAVVACQVPWQIRSARLGPNPYVTQLMSVNPYRPEAGKMTPDAWAQRIKENVVRYTVREIPNAVLPWTTRKLDNKELDPDEWPWMAVVLPLFAFGAWHLRRDRSLAGLLLGCSFGVVMLWPPVWTGTRFMLAMVPFVVLLSVHGARCLLVWLATRAGPFEPVAWAGWALVILPVALHSYDHRLLEGAACTQASVRDVSARMVVKVDVRGRICHAMSVSGLEADRRNPYAGGYAEYMKLGTWARQNLTAPPGRDVIVCCRKPGLFHLMSRHRVTGFLKTADPPELIRDLERKKVTHVVLDQMGFADVGRYLYEAMRRDPVKFPVLKKVAGTSGKDETYLLGFEPRLGYTGEWKDGLKHGHGELRMADGRVFDGTWVNDTMNGEGTLRGPDGTRVEGFWKGNGLHGPGRLTMPDGSSRTGLWDHGRQVRLDDPVPAPTATSPVPRPPARGT